MFHSATLKLTGWYLLILMVISIIFSISIYSITSRELDTRLSRLQSSLQRGSFLPLSDDTLRIDQSSEASSHILIGLIYANIIILGGGGVISYLLARRTLRPIQEAHEAQSRFTSDASHELRTPLAVMKTEIEVVLRDKKSTNDELKEVLQSNLEEVGKLTSLSEMLLHMSRLEHDKLEQVSVDVNAVVKDVLKLYRHNATRVVFKPAKKVMVHGNTAAITELVSILVDNALKYSPPDSQITIMTTRRNRQACFEISNPGKGIDSERLPHIFDRFYQADLSRTNQSQKGYGLGLALAKRIVELHGGELSATSGINQITTFTVLLSLD